MASDDNISSESGSERTVSESKPNVITLSSLVIEPAIAAAPLTFDKEPFLLMVTDITSVQKFCAQLLTQENAGQLKELSDQMKSHYDVAKYAPVHPQKLQVPLNCFFVF